MVSLQSLQRLLSRRLRSNRYQGYAVPSMSGQPLQLGATALIL